MAKGFKTGGRDFKPGHKFSKGRPPLPPDVKQARGLNRIAFERVLNKYIYLTGPEINAAIRNDRLPMLDLIVCKILAKAFNQGDVKRLEFVLDRLIGKVTQPLVDTNPSANYANGQKTFKQFCADAGYPEPFDKQEEMRKFGFEETEPRLLLGSRNYGKTDYVTILGIAYALYLNHELRFLIVTKSKERNAAMLDEIAKALKNNGVTLEKENTTCVRVTSLLGKDHSVSAITIGAKSVRGRHPDMIVMDDPVTEDDDSEAIRRRVKKLYNELHKLCSNILVIGQPVHKADLYADLRPLVKKLEVPYGSIPELDPDLDAQRLAGVDEASIQASYFLKVVSENPTPFEKVQFIDAFPKEGSSVAFIDPSFEGGDYTALTMAKSYFEGLAVRGRVWKKAWNHCLDEIVQELMANGVKRLAFETNSLGDQPVIMLRGALPDGIGVVGKKSTGFKHSRIMNAGVFAEYIWLDKSSDRKYIEQVTQYEYGVKHDDAPDSLASLLEWLGLVRGKKV